MVEWMVREVGHGSREKNELPGKGNALEDGEEGRVVRCKSRGSTERGRKETVLVKEGAECLEIVTGRTNPLQKIEK